MNSVLIRVELVTTPAAKTKNLTFLIFILFISKLSFGQDPEKKKEDEYKLEEVVITNTRSTRTIESTPTRVELIAGEELGSKHRKHS